MKKKLSYYLLIWLIFIAGGLPEASSVFIENNSQNHVLKAASGNMSISSLSDMRWGHTYGGSQTDGAMSAIQTVDGGFALAGDTWSFGAGLGDMWLVKTDASGIMQWNQTYGGPDYDRVFSVIQTTDGGFVLAGLTVSNVTGEDIWLVKADMNGVAQWNQTYGGTHCDEAWAVIQSADGGFVLAGSTVSNETGNRDICLVKTDINGIEQWNRTYGGTQDDEAFSVIQTTDGGFVVTGWTESPETFCRDILLVKTDLNGITEWAQTYGVTEGDEARSVIQTADGGFAIAGHAFFRQASWLDMWLVKTDMNGDMQWHQAYGGTDSDGAVAVIQTTDGGYALTGWTESYGAGSRDMWLVKTDVNGVMQGHQSYGGIDFDQAHSVIQTIDGDFVLAGITTSYGAGVGDMWLVKTSPPSSIPNPKGGIIELPFFFFFLIFIVIIGLIKQTYMRKNDF